MEGNLPAVVADGLTKHFGFVYAVRDVSITVPRRSVLLVVGPNGAGKTTLLRLLATAVRPSAGRAAIFGYDLVREADAVRRVTAFLGTSLGMYDALTARENLAFTAAMSGKPDIGEAVLEHVGLGEVADRPVRTFSQGMKRRLALARPWVQAPRLLLLDDPFSGLDAQGNDLVDTLISDVIDRDGSVILATHEWGRGLSLADIVIALDRGRQIEVASARDFSAPRMHVLAGSPR